MERWWRTDETGLPWYQRISLLVFKRVYITTEHFLNNNLGSYASALTFNTMLAAVPVLAIIFAVARGFGFDNMIENRLRESMLAFSPDMADQMMTFVKSYLQHTKSGIFVGVGLLLLFYTLINLTINIETAFNTIWQVTNSRNIYRRITDYISVFLLLPLLLVITTGMSVYMLSLRTYFADYFILSGTLNAIIALTPFFITSIVLTLLYKLMPNTHVHWMACIGPGIIAGICLQGLEYFYIHYQIKLSSYNAIYGSFAAIPLLLIFIQFTWYICLIGCQLSYANQTVYDYAFERSTRGMSRRFRDSLSLLLVSYVARRFAEGKSPLSQRALARASHLPGALVGRLLDELVNVGVLAITHNEAGTEVLYLPAMDIHRLTVRRVTDALDARGSEAVSDAWLDKNPQWKRLRDIRYHNEDDLVIEVTRS